MKIGFNCYQVLGIPNFSSDKVVKTIFRRLAMIYHPDKGGDQEKMKDINVAYQILKNERDTYDRWLRKQLAPRPQRIVVQIYTTGWGMSDASTTGATTTWGF